MHPKSLPVVLRPYAATIEHYQFVADEDAHEVWLMGKSVDPLAPCHYILETHLQDVIARIKNARVCDCQECIEFLALESYQNKVG